jgi:polyphosphate glucokinase
MTQIAVGVDVGGSGIKAAVVDVASGTLVSSRLRVPTPQPSNPGVVVPSIVRIVRRALKDAGVDPKGVPVGVTMPSVVIDGVTKSAANIDQGWIDYDLQGHLEGPMVGPVVVLNDADAAGLAEMRFGAGAGEAGVVLVLTLGTGVGSGLFNDGILVPNTELGHMEIRGRDAERRSAAIARTRRGLSWKAWASDLDEHLHAIDKLFSPKLIILGGGVSKNADKFIPRLTIRPRVVPATLRNDAGIVGAAMAAAERFVEGGPKAA